MSLANISKEHRPNAAKKRKAFAVLVTTMDAELEFNVEVNNTFCTTSCAYLYNDKYFVIPGLFHGKIPCIFYAKLEEMFISGPHS